TLLLTLFLAACGGGANGFLINNVTISPDSFPVDSQSTANLSVGADVQDDTHVVTAAWMQAEEGTLMLDLTLGASGRWSASIPLRQLDSVPVGVYHIDVHAQDDAGRSIVLENAVQLAVTLH
ncbi:MAG TPA: hypothetical protein VMV18_05410, partial [bacterium]|nr:hypothetical protein [bacterium]